MRTAIYTRISDDHTGEALGVQRHPRCRCQQPERCVIRHEQRCLGGWPRRGTTESEAGSLVECAVAHDGVGRARRHRHRGLQHGSRRRPAAVVHPGEECQVADADIPSNVDLIAGVHRERNHSVDVTGL